MRFGQQYQDYCTEVPMLVPSIQSIRRWQEGTQVLENLQPVEVTEQPMVFGRISLVFAWLIRSDRNIFYHLHTNLREDSFRFSFLSIHPILECSILE